MSGEEQNQQQQQQQSSSELSLSDAGAARAQGSRSRNVSGNIVEASSPTRRIIPTTTPSPQSQQQQQELVIDDSFSEERYSWEESFDSEEIRKPSSRPSSRTSAAGGDRRKQFDTTTPTLVDEEDDEEMLQLAAAQRGRGGSFSYEQQQQLMGADSASSMRRTPGASMYKSSFDSTGGDPMRRTPGASAMMTQNRSESALGTPIVAASSSTTGSATASPAKSTTSTSAAVGLSFAGLSLSTPVQSSGKDDESTSATASPTKEKRIAWDYNEQQDAAASSPETKNRPPTASPAANQPKGPFSFAPWASASEGRGTSSGSGAFSPNILRLTEDLGNLLQEDEDDDYASEIPISFRTAEGGGEGASAVNDFDWTGSYTFDSEHHRKTSAPALPLRATAEKSSRRRTSSGSGGGGQQSRAGFVPFAQQPKPRRTNEAFEFGKTSRSSDDRESPQPLNFGGAFAPPGGSTTGGFMRPVASLLQEETATQQQQRSSSPFVHSAGQHHLAPPRLESMSQQHQQGLMLHVGSVASLGNQGERGMREHAQSFDSYHSARSAAQGQMGGPYFQPNMNPSAASPVYGMPASAYDYASEMHATAQEFVPGIARSSTPQYAQQQPMPQQWPSSQSPAPVQQYTASLEQASWHSTSSYNYSTGANYGYSLQTQSSFADPRAGLTPSPHLQTWPQQQQPAPPPPPQEHVGMYVGGGVGGGAPQQQQARRDGSGGHTQRMSSPHPSAAGSEQSSSTTTQQQQQQTRGGKKESKRKQRGKKKTQKTDTAAGGVGKKGTTGSKKKNTKGEAARPASATQDASEDPQGSATEDPADAKRTELVESPATRIAFKEFYRAFRVEERESFQKAEEFALSALEDSSLPETVHWRVYLELADLAKRSNRYVEARCLYQKVCQLQPYASQGWLEYSKLEEECGHMNRVMNILHKGLEYCEYSENLLTRAVKHQEKMGNLANARGILARLKHAGIEKVWRTVLEGALLEARAGNVATARRVLKYLMHHVPWYGPLYLEAYRLEKDQGHPLDALYVVERGLRAIPRYGPLWFGAFRLCEEMDMTKDLYHLPSTMNMIERAAVSISKELVWKVHLEAAQMLERAAVEQEKSDASLDTVLSPTRRRLAMTILTCPNNLRWKVWLAAARMELGFGNTERARQLFLRAHEVVPKKGRSSTLLECARLEDFTGDTELARAILCKARRDYGHDWKVWLESVLLEIRSGRSLRAMQICAKALELHQGTGRLWATLVQLRQFDGRDEAQLVALKRALNAVPKSGEVWCEGGRVHLNPFSNTFDLDRARRHLHFATRFTPQYGDGFVETIRLEIIEQWLSPIASYIWEETKDAFETGKGDAFEDGLTKYVTDVSLAISVASQPETDKASRKSLPQLVHGDIVSTVRKRLTTEALSTTIDLNPLRLACVNADPNYGLLWFRCRRKTTDTPRRIIEDAAGYIAKELQTYTHLYLAAMIRRKAILSTVDIEKPASLAAGNVETSDPNAVKWEDYIDEKLHAAPSLEDIINPRDPMSGAGLLESTVKGPLFATALTELNTHQQIGNMSLMDRRRALFGNDALFP